MKRNSGINAQILTGWLLLLLFVFPPAARTVHTCQYVYSHNIKHDEHHGHAHHDCNSCAICQFVLSPFTETESVEFDFAVKAVNCEQLTYWENINSPAEYSYMLRAPPEHSPPILRTRA
ncbi:MAG: hypothetical protein LBK97_00335 [Prevotellaceae bacterium]|nr:hypothetical protein [Prevotellaceae bacterium]